MNDFIYDVTLNNVDCTLATFDRSEWRFCKFENVLFDAALMIQTRFWECEFTNVSFVKADLRHCVMNGTTGKGHGFFKNTTFVKSDLRYAAHTNTLYSNCLFLNCNLKDVNFNGARFEDCKFKGSLKSTRFSGKPIVSFGAPVFQNEMKGVDFSEATLDKVDFLDGIDLSNSIIPDSNEYIVVRKNKEKVFSAARMEIEHTWTGNKKAIALTIIDRKYMIQSQADQPIEIVYRSAFEKTELNMFPDLIEKLVKKYE